MLKNDVSIKREKIIIWIFSLKIDDKSLTGRNPPDEIKLKAKFRASKVLIENKFKITKISNVIIEYNTNILIACLNISELSNDIKFVRVFLKFSSYISIRKIIENKK